MLNDSVLLYNIKDIYSLLRGHAKYPHLFCHNSTGWVVYFSLKDNLAFKTSNYGKMKIFWELIFLSCVRTRRTPASPVILATSCSSVASSEIVEWVWFDIVLRREEILSKLGFWGGLGWSREGWEGFGVRFRWTAGSEIF